MAFENVTRRDLPGASTIGDRTTVVLGLAKIKVQADKALRERILATLRTVDVDANGCPVHDPISENPAQRPSPAVDVVTLTGVTSVAACRYGTGPSGPTAWPQMLYSSLRLEGSAAADAITGVAASPRSRVRSGDAPCLPSSEFGDYGLVLRVRSDQGDSRILVRYVGCAHTTGFDDGVTLRSLTSAGRPFFRGPNQPFSMNGDALADLGLPVLSR